MKMCLLGKEKEKGKTKKYKETGGGVRIKRFKMVANEKRKESSRFVEKAAEVAGTKRERDDG